MKRCVLIIALSTVLFTAPTAGAAPTLVKDSKHNLSASGPGTYKAQSPALGGTTEICVFCHTPHGGNTEAPLWNRSTTQSGYVPYASDVMSLMSITAENPSTGSASAIHIKKTRVCLTCHDGTVALGKLVNMPYDSGGTEVAMTPNTKIQQQDAGYIGLDLSDDHPVAVQHDNGKDGELKSPVSSLTRVRLYTTDASNNVIETKNNGGYVECTSCHDPHDNEYGNFLVDPNHNSSICTSCHDKAGFAGSAHDDNTINATYTPPDGIGGYLSGSPTGRVGDVKCMACHFPHKAGLNPGSTTPDAAYGRYLLSFKEENSCFLNNPSDRWGTPNAATACHGTGGWKNIESDVNSSGIGIHQIKDSNTAPRHKATEGQLGWFNTSTVWHVECEDCHNPHSAGKTRHSSPVVPPASPLDSTSPLWGTGGVNVTFPAGGWTSPPNPTTNYQYVKGRGVTDTISNGVDMEYKICLKCHSAYAWNGGATPNSTSLGNVAMTDQAQEFNNNNASYHPVVAANNKNTQGTYVGLWTAKNNQTMYCSDCHTRNGGGSPQGTHGSSNPFILAAPFADLYPTSNSTAQNQSSSDLCFNCHDSGTYLTGTDTFNPGGTGFSTGGGTGTNLHTRHKTLAASSGFSTFAYRCVNCHSRVPHGYKNRAMLVVQFDGFPYEATANQGKITSPLNLPTTRNYTTRDANCSTVAGCHH